MLQLSRQRLKEHGIGEARADYTSNEDEEESDDSPSEHDIFGYAAESESPPRFPSEAEGDDDSSVEREVRFKEKNKREYFDTLDDILE